MDQPILRHRHIAQWSVTAIAAAAILSVSAPSGAQQPAGNANVERGRYLVRITGCHDCHSPKVQGMTPDLDRALSGRPSTPQLPTPATTEAHASLYLTSWTGARGQRPAGTRSRALPP